MSSKSTETFLLVPVEVYSAEARRKLVGLHSSSLLQSLEPKRNKLSEQEIRQDFIEEEKDAESPLETTNKTTQLNIREQLKQQKSNGKNRKRTSVVSVSNKIQSVIVKLLEIDLSSSKLERFRVILQAVFKNFPIVSQQNFQTFNLMEALPNWIC